MSEQQQNSLETNKHDLMVVRIFGEDPEIMQEFHELALNSSGTERVERGFEGSDIMENFSSVFKREWEEYIEEARLTKNLDGKWTARDEMWQLTAQGETSDEALEALGKVIAAAQGEAGHEPTDEEIRELGVDPQAARGDTDSEEDIPDFF